MSKKISKADLAVAAKQSTEIALPGGFVDLNTYQKPEGTVVKTMSPMLKPRDFPAGKVLVGVFTRIFATKPGVEEDGSAKIGEGIEIIPAGREIGVSLPAVATLRTSLEITGKGTEAKSPYIGRTVAIQLLADKIPSRKGNAAWHFIVAIHPEKTN